MQPIVLRPPERRELEPIAQLAAKLVRMHHAFDPARFMLLEPLAVGYEHFFARELGDAAAVLLGAFEGETPVGYAYGRVEPRDWNNLLDGCGAVHDIFVDEGARRRGVARSLMEELIRRLEALGAPRVVLHAAWQNAEAQRFFESLGFRRTMVEMTRG